MAKRSSLRASDADRDRVAERLTVAAGEGRLLAHELEERLSSALCARTYGELDAVVEDLPGGPATGVSTATPRSRRWWRSRQVAAAHPLAGAAILAIVLLAVSSAIAAAAAVIITGAWIVPVGAALIIRGRGRGRGRRAHARRYQQLERSGPQHGWGRF